MSSFVVKGFPLFNESKNFMTYRIRLSEGKKQYVVNFEIRGIERSLNDNEASISIATFYDWEFCFRCHILCRCFGGEEGRFFGVFMHYCRPTKRWHHGRKSRGRCCTGKRRIRLQTSSQLSSNSSMIGKLYMFYIFTSWSRNLDYFLSFSTIYLHFSTRTWMTKCVLKRWSFVSQLVRSFPRITRFVELKMNFLQVISLSLSTKCLLTVVVRVRENSFEWPFFWKSTSGHFTKIILIINYYCKQGKFKPSSTFSP